jgi:hypothetical protein
VFVLTDGSGHSGISRLPYTTRTLEDAQAKRGGLYGRFTDRALYAAILRHDFGLFQQLIDELASVLTDGTFTDVVGDAAEGYNPAHDLGRLLINAAVDIARRERALCIRNFEFSPIGAPEWSPDGSRDGAFWRDLDEGALARKVAAARAYTPLRAEVDAALRGEGIDAFRREWLRPVNDPAGRYQLAELPPFYERYGAERVAAGYYERVVSHREHMVPLAEAIRAHVGSGAGSRGAR